MVMTQPSFKFYVNEKNQITEDTCVVLDKGCFLLDEQTEHAQISAYLSYDIDGDIKEQKIKINLLNGAVDTEHPIEMKCIIYPKEFDVRKIQLFIRDHERPEIIAAF